MRRTAQEAFTKPAVQRHHSTLTKEASILTSAILANPKNRHQHFQRATASAILSILYDHPTLTSAEDKVVQEIAGNVDSLLRAAVGTTLVEFFPWMMCIPKWSRHFFMIKRTHFTSNEMTGSRSGRGKLWNDLPSVPSCIYDFSIVSNRTLCVPLLHCVGGWRIMTDPYR